MNKKVIMSLAASAVVLAGSSALVVNNESSEQVDNAVVHIAAVAYTNEPLYIRGQYYVWEADEGAAASNSLAYVNSSVIFPVTGDNAHNGEKQPDKAKASRWSDQVLIRVDGKYCYQRIPTTTLDYVGSTMSDRLAFLNTFGPAIEVYQPDWFVVVEEE